MSSRRIMVPNTLAVLAVWLCAWTSAEAQESTVEVRPSSAVRSEMDAAREDPVAEVHRLRDALEVIRVQLATSQLETAALREELRAVRERLEAVARAVSAAAPQTPSPASAQVADLAQEQELLTAKVVDLEQTKVESGSRYHVRLSGLALVNLVSTQGSVDSLDLPFLAQPRPASESGGTVGATVRQSRVGLEVFGPAVRGGRARGHLDADFFGSFPATSDGLSTGHVRLRTASIGFEWTGASIVAGQEGVFFSPLSPTSLASSAYPALSYAGNLWAWTPHVRVEHRIARPDGSRFMVQWGLLDPLTGEVPAGEYSRLPTAGERSRVPAGAARVSWQRSMDQPTLALGGGGYYARQNWGFGRTVDGWAATADWDVALGPGVSLSGEVYRGRAIGGLGAGSSGSVLFAGAPTMPSSAVLPLDSAGGWVQLKIAPTSRLEFNATFGEDHAFRNGLARLLAVGRVDGTIVNRNATGFLNAIYHLRSNLVVSVEYRRLSTVRFDALKSTADHISLSGGIGF